MPQRVKDKRTGHEFTVSVVNPKHHEVLDKPAVDRQGRHLPAKPKQVIAPANTGAPTDSKKEGSK